MQNAVSNAATLEITTPSEREIVMSRVFDAPRNLVFDAWTKPELVKQWLTGPEGWTMVICEIDLKVGGKYRYVMSNTDGMDMGWGGVYREIVPPERFVNTELFDEGWYPGESLITTVLVEEDGRTKLTQTMLFESQDARDIAAGSGMESGIAPSFDRLEELLASLRQ